MIFVQFNIRSKTSMACEGYTAMPWSHYLG